MAIFQQLNQLSIRFNKEILKILFLAFREYFKLIERLIQRVHPKFNFEKLILGDNIDERISKIDDARRNLVEAIAAIDDLRHQADANKSDLTEALSKLRQMEAERSVVHTELQTLKQIAQADTESFRKIIGVQSRADVWRERIIGFISGVVASVLATGIVLVLQKFI